MKHRRFSAGETLVRLGDPPSHAFVILQGEVEITKGGHVETAERQSRGHVIGDTAIMIGRPSQVACRAVVDTTVAMIAREDFLAAMDAKGSVIVPFMKRLFESLVDLQGLLSKNLPAVVLVAEAPKFAIRILPSSQKLKTQMLPDGYEINALPFRVGRKVDDGESEPGAGIELTLDDVKPFNLSRQHFSIEPGAGGPIVKDIWSQLGTVVNGVRIGRSKTNQAQALVTGENLVVAGRPSSHFVFRLIVN
ncbi:MAG: cyclic nucleotide-binding domain-containing protein [Alphaproteobacteria bacterium]